MTERLDLYKCKICGNLIEVVLPGVGELVCCGGPMEFLDAKTNDTEYGEKHVPVISDVEQGVEVRVGTSLHPMLNEHYIQFVESVFDGKNKVMRQYFTPQDLPIMVLRDKLGLEKARDFCNIHGLWEANL